MRTLLNCFDVLAVQNETYAKRLMMLEAPRLRLEVTGSIKFDQVESDAVVQQECAVTFCNAQALPIAMFLKCPRLAVHNIPFAGPIFKVIFKEQWHLLLRIVWLRFNRGLNGVVDLSEHAFGRLQRRSGATESDEKHE